ncbi:MAG TPA: hypothetical protein VFF65_07035 [Phycisphaerales bacterium]|nr:hypothetical protein [Phycisphaerales bacterium]
MRLPHARRAGLTINPLVFLLLLALIAVFVWRGWVTLDLVSRAAPNLPAGAKSAGLVGAVIGCVLGVLLCCALAGGVGLALYFMTGRSEGAANAGIGVVLLLTLGICTYTTYTLSTQPVPVAAAANARSPLSSQLDRLADQQKQMQQLNEANRRATQEMMDRARQAAQRPYSPNQPPAGITARPESPAGSPPSPPNPSEPAPPVQPTADELASAQKAKEALAPLRAEATKKAADFVARAQSAADALAKSPRAVRSDLDKRVSESAELKQQASELEDYMRSLDQRATDALKAAGLDFGAQVREQVAFSQGADAFDRAGACRVYAAFFDASLEEGQALKESAGRWRTDAAGNVTSTDAGLQGRLRLLREAVNRRARELPDARAKLTRPMGG